MSLFVGVAMDRESSAKKAAMQPKRSWINMTAVEIVQLLLNTGHNKCPTQRNVAK